MERVTLVGLLKLELPGGRDVLLCDGGVVPYAGQLYQSADDTFGTVSTFEALTEGTGDELPAGTITFLPRDAAAAIDLSQPAYQNSRLRMWIGEVDEASGRLVGEPDLMADWQTDKTVIRRQTGSRALAMGCVTRSQRLLIRNDGNALSSSSHQRVFAGERGFDNAVGMDLEIPWGVVSPPRGVQRV
ncbi:hypothetical protein [Sphingomonas hankookensis]|jgi:hypothetical protein